MTVAKNKIMIIVAHDIGAQRIFHKRRSQFVFGDGGANGAFGIDDTYELLKFRIDTF